MHSTSITMLALYTLFEVRAFYMHCHPCILHASRYVHSTYIEVGVFYMDHDPPSELPDLGLTDLPGGACSAR